MTGPVTLITGTRKGIGRHLAEHYLEAGHQVVGVSRRESDLDHDNYRHIGLDVTDEEPVLQLFKMIRAEFGQLDNLLNNAGIASMNHALLTPMKTVEKVMATNFFGTFLFCREAAKMMKRSKSGRIVNFSTVAVPMKLEGEAAYVASKSAVEALTGVLARELAPFGITVNAVAPVPIETDLIRSVPEEKIKALVRRQAIRRLGTVADVANVVDFFISPASSFVTGQTVYLGGV